jgi:hypothetical protein
MMVSTQSKGSHGNRAPRRRAATRAVAALPFVVLTAGVAAAQPNSGLVGAWSTECFAAAKKDGARTGRANRYCDCTSAFVLRSGGPNYAAWRRTHPDEAAFCAEKAGITTGPGRGY